MKRYDQIIGLIWFALGSGMAIEAIHLGLGELHLPGIGFMPFLVGVSLGLFGFILTVLATVKGKRDDSKIWEGQNWKNVVLPLLALVIYVVLMEPLGFLPTTFLLQFFLLKLTAPKRWFVPMVTSLLIVFFCYLIFSLWLKIPLPKGLFRIG
jgi:putative tricarboxylic transport membrane protein